jgi:hypothetical protein
MDAQHFREKAEVLVRLANDLSLNDSGRLKLVEIAPPNKLVRSVSHEGAIGIGS